ncbi:MAG: AAC(3) family N-acetyltransferase [Anaerolineae bacterium]|jgi:aminoglycoside 3-N-acetyltransferase|nr:AAC(3) family N-acetyltransferase [Anaerolineae bacterium]MBT7073326.1 AAC(3) family N-acetyltransferase [Anaerolineae bacterium]MBT7782233.1 AAC(3) family N-acetyltransferase [Anaerolineae bacterium]
MLTLPQLTENFRALGVEKGDTLLVHSSYKSFGGVDGGPQAVIDAFLEVLGENGTLLMPTFNFDFCKGVDWDVRETPSQMGYMTNLVRTDPRATRVFHPIYSFAVIGKYAQAFGDLRDKSSYGANSAFAKLCELDGKIMVIGLSYNDSMTFFHHIEEMEGVDYRYLKDFTGNITDWEGNTTIDTYQMLVRNLEMKVETMVDPMGALMEEKGVIKSRIIGEADVKLMKANEVYDFTLREMKRDPYLLYQISK